MSQRSSGRSGAGGDQNVPPSNTNASRAFTPAATQQPNPTMQSSLLVRSRGTAPPPRPASALGATSSRLNATATNKVRSPVARSPSHRLTPLPSDGALKRRW